MGETEGREDPEKQKENENWRGWELVWDRKIEGGFPEMKVLVSQLALHERRTRAVSDRRGS